ncbi:hypothetical protein QEN19_002115 [Hanseniaspora menglaensis]
MPENISNEDNDDFIVADVSSSTSNMINIAKSQPQQQLYDKDEAVNINPTENDPEYMGTLNESIYTTLMRDVSHIKLRIVKVLYPSSLKSMFLPMTMNEIREEDLDHLDSASINSAIETSVTDSPEMWAPLIFNLAYSKILANSHQTFAFIFIMTWILMGILSFHLKIYSKISILGKISLLLYCFLPVLLNSIVIKLIFNPLFLNKFFMSSQFLGMKVLGLLIKILITFVFTLWSFYSCLVQLWKEFSDSNSSLSVDNWSTLFSFKNIPVFLVYLFLNWLNVL